ncbi:MAG: hypothetical protein IT204_24055 [Fimbriimonadaceae bacterium]|nr:hypothetical protein [Fimbriimonadaceae bacterium]
MRGGVLGGLTLVSLALASLAAPPANTSPALKKEWLLCKERAEVAAEQHNPLAAIGTLEEFLRAHPADFPYARSAAVMINGYVSGQLQEPGQRLAIYRRATESFTQSPDYYAFGAAGLVRQALADRDLPLAQQRLTAAFAVLGEQLSVDHYLGFNLWILRLQLLRAEGQPTAGLAQARQDVARSPWMLGDRGFLRAVYDLARDQGDQTVQLQAAKLHYLLGDFEATVVQESVELVAAGLTAAHGPGEARRFALAQEDRAAPNPLRAITVFDCGPPAALLEAAQSDSEARLNVLLYAGRLAGAVSEARKLLQRAGQQNPYYAARALRHLARCFKAHDLCLVRANAFLEFHASGQGANPLAEFEAELQREEQP